MAGPTTQEPNGTCRSCPMCAFIATVSELQPEAAQHLAAAGRELLLALGAVLADVQPEEGADVYGPERRGTSPGTAGDRAADVDGRSQAATTLRRIAVD